MRRMVLAVIKAVCGSAARFQGITQGLLQHFTAYTWFTSLTSVPQHGYCQAAIKRTHGCVCFGLSVDCTHIATHAAHATAQRVLQKAQQNQGGTC